jgi:hypothetical protein
MLDFARSGKGRINEVWGGDLASYEKDVMQYLDNHANERPGETGIGIDKRNAINYLFGITNISNKNANPMYAMEGRPPGSLVKSYRLDRIANSRDTGRTGFFFDYQKQAANLAPGERFAPAEAPAKTPLTDEAGFKKSNSYLTFLNYVSDEAVFFAHKIMNTFRNFFFLNPHNSLIFHFF